MLEPRGHLIQRYDVEVARARLRRLPALDQPSALKYPEVLGYRGLSDREWLLKLRYGCIAFRQTKQNSATRWIGQRGEFEVGDSSISIRLYNHSDMEGRNTLAARFIAQDG